MNNLIEIKNLKKIFNLYNNENLLIFDAGTGLRELAVNLKGREPVEANLFLTHTHLDHVCGLPFFEPLFRPDTKLQIWAGHLPTELSIREVIDRLMMDPLWPVQLKDVKGRITFHNFSAGEVPGIKSSVFLSQSGCEIPSYSKVQ